MLLNISKWAFIHLPHGHHLDSCFEMSVRDEEKMPNCVSLQNEAHTPNYTQHTHTRYACKEELTMSAALLRLWAGVPNLHKKVCEYLCVSAGLISTLNVLHPAPWLEEADWTEYLLVCTQITNFVVTQLLLILTVSWLKSVAVMLFLWFDSCFIHLSNDVHAHQG